MEKSSLEDYFSWFPEPELARSLFTIIEGERIDSHVRYWYPGLSSGLEHMKNDEFKRRPILSGCELKQGKALEALVQYSLLRKIKGELSPDVEQLYRKLVTLAEPVWDCFATATDTARASSEAYVLLHNEFSKNRNTGASPLPMPVSYRGELNPEQVQKNQAALQQSAEKVRESLAKQGVQVSQKEILKALWGKELSAQELRDTTDELAQKALQEISSNSAGGRGRPQKYQHLETNLQAYEYNYEPLIEVLAPKEDPTEAKRIMQSARGSIRHICRSFEQLRPSALIKNRRQERGEDIDFDSAVDSYIDWKRTGWHDERIYLLQERKRRDVFTGVVIDASGSTSERVLECEKEGTFALTQALERIGDDYCAYAFSGNTFLCSKSRAKYTQKEYAIELLDCTQQMALP